jgi:hypothetical protein
MDQRFVRLIRDIVSKVAGALLVPLADLGKTGTFSGYGPWNVPMTIFQ